MAMLFSSTNYFSIVQSYPTFIPASFCLWVNFTALNTGVTDTGGYQTNRLYGVDDVWEVRATTDYGTHLTWYFVNEMYASATTTPPPATSTTVPVPGVWYHVICTADATKYDQIFINGVYQAGGPCADTPSSTTMTIGNRLDGVNQTCTNGILDDVRVYNRVLTASEAATIYACRGSDNIYYGLTNRWLMNEGAAGISATETGIMRDTVGNTTGTPVNSPKWTTTFLKTRVK